MKLAFRKGHLPSPKNRLSTLLPQVAFIAIPGMVQAQQVGPSDDDTQLDVVKVTAERRETELQKTPVSVGVINTEAIEKTGFQHIFDIEKSVAGVTFYKGAANQQSNIIIRGVGTLNMGYTSAVGVYVDDVPLIRGGASGQWDLPDIERIEVLKGPQGTLYGQNSSAGAVRIVSRDPGDQKSGWVSAGTGNYGAFETRGYFSGPIQEGLLSGSLAFSHRENDGYGKNYSTGDDTYATNATQSRTKLRFTPNEDWDAVLSIDTLLDKSDNGTKSPVNYGTNSPRDTYSLKDLDARLERNGLNLRVTKTLNDTTDVRSITGWRYWRHDPSPMDHGGLPRVSQDNDNIWQQRIFYQELQLLGELSDRLSYTAGLNLTREYFKNDAISQTSTDGININRARRITVFETDDIAGYVQFNYQLTERWTLTSGARYWRSQQEYRGASLRLDEDYQITSQVFAVEGLKKRSEGVTPRLTLGYQWTPDLYAYGSYTEGAKFGGHNRSASTEAVAMVAADPEKVNAYEFGIKASTFDHRLQINAAVFYNQYKDYNATVTNPVLNGVQYEGAVLTNAGEADTYGAELELRTRLTQRLNWSFSLAYLKSEFKDFLNPSGSAAGDYTGNELPFAPRITASTGLSYTQPFANGSELDLFGSVQYISEQEIDAANTAGQAVPSRTNVDAGADYRFPGKKWTGTLRIRNLLDRDQVLHQTYTPLYGIKSDAYDVPRTFVVGLRYDF